MNFQIREAITANMKNNSANDIKGIVDDAIQRGEEQMLPGLGVFFEKLWNRADEQEKEKISGEIAQAFSGQ
ncbi:small, acid-soluble spore protein I [Sporosarcina sp. NCCP-2222]|uniref:small acid-soluble spore protein SspI n=1 Tax=Sporosarcina TaxID=1569 RepID=UPI001EE05DDD|nr:MULTISPECIES: small acid-soluble spore protein SspI [Sporosarcina]MCG3089341.1 small acid-soluble spore protein SspI [Sporosarcina cyprini]GKV54524.1 small, acid-soluble spore protein I [Sporosarcina sp. NCCP-2222]